MSFAAHVAPLSLDELERLRRLADRAQFRQVPTREYDDAEVRNFWEPCVRAFFIRLRPGMSIHRHSDEAIKGTTHHLVLQSNPQALNWWLENGQERSIHLQAGHRYDVAREPVHWATNAGDTARIHLLVEYGDRPWRN